MDPIRRAVTTMIALAPFASFANEPFPDRPLRLVVPNPPGGTVDVVARLLAQGLGESLGQPIVVDARPGANTVIGTEFVVRAPADGHTIALIGTPFATNPFVRRLPYDTFRDFTPVAQFAVVPFVIAVGSGSAVRSLRELVDAARRKPGALNYASFGLGQLLMEALKRNAAVDFHYVPYTGGVQATLAVVAEHADVLVAPLSDAMPHIESGKLRPLAVTSTTRVDVLSDVADARRSRLRYTRLERLDRRRGVSRHAARSRRAARPRDGAIAATAAGGGHPAALAGGTCLPGSGRIPAGDRRTRPGL